MAALGHPLGYQCEFTDSVSEYFYCKSCNLVARKATITTCCGETYCHACIAQEQGKPCPACGEKDFTFTKMMKYQKGIEKLQAYCNMKERGCDWSGPLEQLYTHLDPDQDNCQYVDTECPLHCEMAVPKNKVEQHVAEDCAKRPYVCQYCNFKATYEEVVNKHIPKCKYVPLQCPNLCGVNFERDFMEDHMKICCLEEVRCEFSGVGCEDCFKRKDQEEHIKQNSRKHLSLTNAAAEKTKEQLQDQVKKYGEWEQNVKQKLEELEQKLQQQERKLEEKEQRLQKQEQKLKEQEWKLTEQERKNNEQEAKLKELEHNLKKQELKNEEWERMNNDQDQKFKEMFKEPEQLFASRLQELEQRFQKMLKGLSDETEAKFSSFMPRAFTMEKFSMEKDKGRNVRDTWYGPAMYTHVGGYKFRIGVLANGLGSGHGKAIAAQLFSLPGECDDQLKWPVKAKFILDLVNQRGGNNATAEASVSWNKSESEKHIKSFFRINIGGYYHFIEHSCLKDYLVDDKIHFVLSKVVLSG